MKLSTYNQYSQSEASHWWWQARADLAAWFIQKMALHIDSRILDVGCGTGTTTRFLEQYGKVIGVDTSKIALQCAAKKSPSLAFIAGDANSIDRLFPAGWFDLITFFNVLYHMRISDDVKILTKVERILKPGGYVLFSEPAYKILMRRHDFLVEGKTRYRLSDFETYFSEVGIDYKWGQYFNAISFPICLASGVIYKVFGEKLWRDNEIREIVVPPKCINSMMKIYSKIERALFAWIGIPIGVTLMVVGRKPISR